MTRALLTMEGLAAKLGRGREWLYKHWRHLVAQHGFPRPVPGLGKRWDPAAVDCWLDSHIPPELLAARQADPAISADHSALLDQRAEALAREVH